MKILEKQISSLDNAQQLAAIQSTDKNILIVAGVGQNSHNRTEDQIYGGQQTHISFINTCYNFY